MEDDNEIEFTSFLAATMDVNLGLLDITFLSVFVLSKTE